MRTYADLLSYTSASDAHVCAFRKKPDFYAMAIITTLLIVN